MTLEVLSISWNALAIRLLGLYESLLAALPEAQPAEEWNSHLSTVHLS